MWQAHVFYTPTNQEVSHFEFTVHFVMFCHELRNCGSLNINGGHRKRNGTPSHSIPNIKNQSHGNQSVFSDEATAATCPTVGQRPVEQ